MDKPATAAGRTLLDLLFRHGITDDLDLDAAAILAIEREAAAPLRQLALDVVDYCNDPKLVAQARAALAEPPTGGTDLAAAAYVQGHKDRWNRDREPDVLCRNCGKPWAVPTGGTDHE